jgi:hypothetical protein
VMTSVAGVGMTRHDVIRISDPSSILQSSPAIAAYIISDNKSFVPGKLLWNAHFACT